MLGIVIMKSLSLRIDHPSNLEILRYRFSRTSYLQDGNYGIRVQNATGGLLRLVLKCI